MQSRRIDGATSLDMREAAIQEFNNPDTGEHSWESRARRADIVEDRLCLVVMNTAWVRGTQVAGQPPQ